MTAKAKFSRRAAIVGAAAIGLGAVGSYQVLSGSEFQGAALDPDDAHRKAAAGEIVLIDIRRPDEWKRTGIGQGAHPIDMRRPDFIEVLAGVTGGARDTPVALICAGGVRSARLGRKLSEAGFKTIIDVPEGMLGSAAGPGWVRRGLPVRTYSEQSG